MSYQYTLNRLTTIAGVGLHSGEKVTISLWPAPVNSGIKFLRTDLLQSPVIPASSEYIDSTMLCTTLSANGDRLATVEHILAALRGLNVDNAIVEVDGPELPIMDGSALPFVEAIVQVGLRKQPEPRKYIMINKPIEVSEGESRAALYPHTGFSIFYTIQFNHPAVTLQSKYVRVTPKNFADELAPARTFGFLKDIEMMRRNGLARGGSLENAVVLGTTEVLNREGLRFPDEFVRHKILDSVGDLSLLGAPLIGHFLGYKSGHQLNTRLVMKVLEEKQAWEYVTLPSDDNSTVYNFPQSRIEARVGRMQLF